MNILNEIYQFIFISATIYLSLVFGDLFMKLYGRFRFKTDVRFKQNNIEKLLFIVSLSIFLTYIIK